MRRVIAPLVILTMAGCSNALYFGTYSRIGIDASTDGAGIGAKHSEIVVSPTKSDGSAHDVLGRADHDLSLISAVIDEEFAVGEAARCAAARVVSQQDAAKGFVAIDPNDPSTISEVDGQENTKLIFGAHTSYSLVDLAWGESAVRGINFGFKRSVGVRMPIKDDSLGSAYTRIRLNTLSASELNDPNEPGYAPPDPNNPGPPVSRTGGVRTKSVFATGVAAIIMANERASEITEVEGAKAGYQCIVSDGS